MGFFFRVALLLICYHNLTSPQFIVESPISENLVLPVINEVYISPNPDHDESFIEIRIPPTSQSPLLYDDVDDLIRDFAIFILEDDPTRITRYIDLSEAVWDDREVEDDKYFVICTEDYATNCAAITTRQFVGNKKTLILLARRPSNEQLQPLGLALDGTFIFLETSSPLGIEQLNMINSLSVDAMTLANNINLIPEPWIQTILPNFIGHSQILPVGSSEILDKFSLSRCSEELQSSKPFFYSPPSPGISNICLTENPVQRWFDNIENAEPQTEDTNPLARHGDPNLEKITPNVPLASVENRISNCIDKIPLELTNGELREYLLENDKRDVLSFLESESNPPEVSLRCEACAYMLQHSPHKIPANRVTDIMRPTGMKFRKQAKRTKEVLGRHFGTNGIHNFVLDELEKIRCEQTDVGSTSCVADRKNDIERMIGLVYLETKLGFSFRSHEGLTTGLEQLQITMAKTLRSEKSARRIVQHTSKFLNKTMIDYMVTNRCPFTLMADSSSDIGGIHGLLIYVIFVEHSKVAVRMWRYVEAVHTSGQGLFNVLLELIREAEEGHPGFEAYFKENLESTATDGASNVLYSSVSFTQKLDEYVSESRGGRPLTKYHCSNHRLALAYTDIMYSNKDELKFCQQIINHCNVLALFYSTRAYRRRAEFADESRESRSSVRRFRKIQKVRWMPATQESYSIVYQNYNILMKHLNRITAGTTDYTPETRTQAENLRIIFSDRHLLSTFCHHLDIITILSVWSKEMERNTNNVMNIEEWRDNVQKNLETLLATPGTQLSAFYQECMCDGNICNEDTYHTADQIQFKGTTLSNEGSNIPPLTETKQAVVLEMLEALERRFPSSAISAFTSLNPPQFKTETMSGFNILGEHLNRYHGIPADVSMDFYRLQQYMIAEHFFDDLELMKQPVSFWEHTVPQIEIITSNSKLLNSITIALIQPASTARVEAGFSLTNFIKSKYRSSLTIQMVEHILRIKFNGPSLTMLPLSQIADEWVTNAM